MATPLSSAAVVLRTINYSDSSLIVRLFTELYGRVTVIAKGARRIRNATIGILQSPNHITVWYQHKEGRDVQTLIKSEFVERYARLSSRLAQSAAALVALEMLDRAVHDADPHALIFRLITSTLRRLDETTGDEMLILHFFQLHLARQLGFGPQFSACAQCGRQLLRAILDGETGRLLCSRCESGGTARLGRPALQHLQKLGATHISQLETLRPSHHTNEEVGDFLLKHLFHHVDGMSHLKSINFWRQVAA